MKLFRFGMVATVLAVGCVAFAEKDDATPVAVRCEGRIGREGYGAPNWWLERLNGRRRLVAESGGKYDLVMLGDSITHNFDMRRDDPGRPGPGHAALKEIERTHSVLNCGYSGDGYEHVLWRVRNGELEGVRAGTIMLLVGTNNRHGNPEETARGIRAILDELIVRQPQARILLLAIFPCGSSADDPGRRINERVNEIIRSYADGSRVIWIDLREKFLDAQGDTAWIMPDRLHPTAKGYEEIWLPAILRHMQMELPLAGSSKPGGWDAEPFTVGAIRWDAWYGESEDKDETTAQEVIKTLSPECYHWRLPFFAEVGTDGFVRIDGRKPGVMEREIDYAADHGIDYWAFLVYHKGVCLNHGLQRYFHAKNRDRIRFCMILRLMEKAKREDLWVDLRDRWLQYLDEPGYMRVCGGRELVYAYPPVEKKYLYEFLSMARARGHNPYLVSLTYPRPVPREKVLADCPGYAAVGAYDCIGDTRDYGRLIDLAEKNQWQSAVREGLVLVPSVAAGGDASPRRDTEVSWMRGAFKGKEFHPPLTRSQITDAMRRVKRFVLEHPATCAPKTCLWYAWNEFDEGGWLCPTWTSDGPDVMRLEALQDGLK